MVIESARAGDPIVSARRAMAKGLIGGFYAVNLGSERRSSRSVL